MHSGEDAVTQTRWPAAAAVTLLVLNAAPARADLCPGAGGIDCLDPSLAAAEHALAMALAAPRQEVPREGAFVALSMPQPGTTWIPALRWAAAEAAVRATTEAATRSVELAVRAATDTLSYLSATAEAVGGGADVASSVSTHASEMSHAGAATATLEHDEASREVDENVDEARELMRIFGRLAEIMSGIREETVAARRAAILRV